MITLEGMIALTEYDIKIGKEFRQTASDAKQYDSVDYWTGWISAKEQDLNRLIRLKG